MVKFPGQDRLLAGGTQPVGLDSFIEWWKILIKRSHMTELACAGGDGFVVKLAAGVWWDKDGGTSAFAIVVEVVGIAVMLPLFPQLGEAYQKWILDITVLDYSIYEKIKPIFTCEENSRAYNYAQGWAEPAIFWDPIPVTYPKTGQIARFWQDEIRHSRGLTDDNKLTMCNCCNLAEDLPFCRPSIMRRRRSVIVRERGNGRFKYDMSDTLDLRFASLCYWVS